MRKYIETGRITRPHGINGAVRAEAWCDSPAVLAGLGTVYTEKNGTYTGVRIAKGSVQKDHVILKLEGTDTPEAAERLRGTVIYADRNDIPVREGAFLIDDLKGLDVTDFSSGKLYGPSRTLFRERRATFTRSQPEKAVFLSLPSKSS